MDFALFNQMRAKIVPLHGKLKLKSLNAIIWLLNWFYLLSYAFVYC